MSSGNDLFSLTTTKFTVLFINYSLLILFYNKNVFSFPTNGRFVEPDGNKMIWSSEPVTKLFFQLYVQIGSSFLKTITTIRHQKDILREAGTGHEHAPNQGHQWDFTSHGTASNAPRYDFDSYKSDRKDPTETTCTTGQYQFGCRAQYWTIVQQADVFECSLVTSILNRVDDNI